MISPSSLVDLRRAAELSHGHDESRFKQAAILQAEGYALDRVNRAQGDAARFNTIYEAYRQAPDVTRRRLYLETMQRVLPKVGGKVFLAEDATGVLPLLSLDALRQTVASDAPAPPAGARAGTGGDR